MAAFIAPLVAGIAGLFGGGTQQKQQTSGVINTNTSQQQQQTGTNASTSTNTPNLSPFQQQLASVFTQGATNLFNQASNMSGYTQQGLEGINNTAGLNSQVLNNTLASRGLSYSPAAANAQVQNQLSRTAQSNTFLQQVPLLQRQLQSQALGQVMQAFGVLPTGSTQTGNQTSNVNSSGTSTSSQTQQGTNLVSGNPVAGALSGIGAGLFTPYGVNSNGQPQTALGSIINMFGGNN
jgi:hypothetical protein